MKTDRRGKNRDKTIAKISDKISAKLALILLTAAASFAAWSGAFVTLAIPAFALPAVYDVAQRRRDVAVLAATYYGVALRDIPPAGAEFFGRGGAGAWTAGVAIWLGLSALLAGVWSICWSQRRPGASYLAGLTVVSVPPVGLAGMAGPLVGAGVLYPHAGLAGIFATAGLGAAIASRRWRFTLALITAAVIANFALICAPARHAQIVGISTQLAETTGGAAREAQLESIVARARSGSTVLLPESVAGRWRWATPTQWRDFMRRHPQLHVLVGADVATPAGTADALVSARSGRIVARARVPIPIAEWRPWSSSSFPMHLLGDGIRQIGGQRVETLICYEQMIPWPALMGLSVGGFSALLAPANDWWAGASDEPSIQYESARAWGRLMGVPVVHAVNSEFSLNSR